MSKVLSVLVLVLILLVGVVPANAQDEDICLQQGGTWDPATGKCEVALSLTMNIDYPMEFVSYPFAKDALDQFVRDSRIAFLTPLTTPDFYYSPGPLALDITYQTFQFSDTVTSVQFDVYEYTGGAHPNSYYRTFVFDLGQERVLTLNDLFVAGVNPLDTIFPIVQADLQAQLTTMEVPADGAWIDDGTGTIPENYQNFVLTEDSLIFLFPPYQVAPYAVGPFTVTIPLANLSGILAPEFVH
jgi:hypothetical protein